MQRRKKENVRIVRVLLKRMVMQEIGLWFASTNESWIEANISNMMTVCYPCHESIETKTITTMRKCSIFTLERKTRIPLVRGRQDLLDPNTNSMVLVWDHSFENYRINLGNLSSSYYHQQFHQHQALKRRPREWMREFWCIGKCGILLIQSSECL